MTFKGILAISAIGLNKAATIVGSERILAKKISAHRQNFRYWRLEGLIPYDKAIEIVFATDGKVRLNELRPDLKELNKRLDIAFPVPPDHKNE